VLAVAWVPLNTYIVLLPHVNARVNDVTPIRSTGEREEARRPKGRGNEHTGHLVVHLAKWWYERRGSAESGRHLPPAPAAATAARRGGGDAPLRVGSHRVID
jgi:hypothetical protein